MSDAGKNPDWMSVAGIALLTAFLCVIGFLFPRKLFSLFTWSPGFVLFWRALVVFLFVAVSASFLWRWMAWIAVIPLLLIQSLPEVRLLLALHPNVVGLPTFSLFGDLLAIVTSTIITILLLRSARYAALLNIGLLIGAVSFAVQVAP